MKNISSFISEKLKVSSNVKTGDCTVEEFLEWYYFGYTKSIDDLTFDEFTVVDFDPAACEVYFGNNEQKMYDFLMNNLDVEIELVGLRCCNLSSKGPNLTIKGVEYNNVDAGTLVDILDKVFKE
jgi:hypothetical protein